MAVLVELPESSGGQIMGFILSISFRRGSLDSHITWVMNNGPIKAVVQRCSLTNRHELKTSQGRFNCHDQETQNSKSVVQKMQFGFTVFRYQNTF
jgi:hypothetical protein